MKLSEKGRRFIAREEGVVLRAYRCQAGVLTIGLGHTGPDVVEGMRITKEQALELFSADVRRFEDAVSRVDRKILPDSSGKASPFLLQHEFDALVSFAFNVGVGAFERSQLARCVLDGRMKDAAAEFPKWVKGGGKVLPVLVARRKRERKLFEAGDYGVT